MNVVINFPSVTLPSIIDGATVGKLGALLVALLSAVKTTKVLTGEDPQLSDTATIIFHHTVGTVQYTLQDIMDVNIAVQLQTDLAGLTLTAVEYAE